MCLDRGRVMKRWYLAASVMVALSSPAALLAQNGGTGFSGGSPSGGGSGFGGSGTGSGSSTGLAGSANTTLLGTQVNTSFNSVFGTTSAALVNTTANPFGAYVAPVSTSSSSRGTSGGSGFSNSFMGGSSGSSGLGTGSGGLAGGLGGATGGRSSIGGLSSGGLSGTGGLSSGGLGGGLSGGGLGGGLGSGGLGGNRGGLGGGLTGGGLGGNRNMMGGSVQGGAGGFMGGMNNQQNTNQPAPGYTVNFEGHSATQIPVSTTLTPNADFQQRLTASPGMLNSSGLQVFTRGETAILRGQVSSEYAKHLASAMIRLEPGVYDVQNELVVAPPKQQAP
jgi:BON domain